MPTANALVDRVRALFETALQLDVPGATADLFESGALDSMLFVELLLHIEQTFGVRISLEDLELDDFRTIERIAAVIAANAPTAVHDTPS